MTRTNDRTIGVMRGGLVLTLAVALTGCGDAPAVDLQAFEETDSAGILIQTSSGPDVPLTVREAFRVGVVDGDADYLFHEIFAIAVEPGGSFWVADRGEVIRRYSADGAYLGSVGGAGQGPGEAMRGYQAVWTGDGTVYAGDYYAARAQLFEVGGEYVGQRALFTPDFAAVEPMVDTGAGWLFKGLVRPEVGDPDPHERWVIHLGSPTGTDVDSLLTLRGRTLLPTGNPRYPFRRTPFFDGVPDIRASASGETFASDPSEHRVDVFGADGAWARSIRRDVTRLPFDPSWQDGFVELYSEYWREDFGSPIDDEQLRDGIASAFPTEPPDFVPVLDRILVDRDGTLWARRVDQHPAMTLRAVAGAFGTVEPHWHDDWRADWVFDVFDPYGRYRGTATVPRDYVPIAAHGTRLYAIVKNDLDVQFVAVLEVG